jgi:hypothetical protein
MDRQLAGRRKTLRKAFDRCVKSVRKTVKARKGSTKESAAIAICTNSVLQTRGRTLKRYTKGRLTTQARLRGGELPPEDRAMLEKAALVTGKPPATPVQEDPEWVRSTFEAPLPPGWTALGAVGRDADEQEVVYRHPMGKPRPTDDKLPAGIVKRDGKYYAKRVSQYTGSRRTTRSTRRRKH